MHPGRSSGIGDRRSIPRLGGKTPLHERGGGWPRGRASDNRGPFSLVGAPEQVAHPDTINGLDAVAKGPTAVGGTTAFCGIDAINQIS
jgi:hypothetical protein